MSFLWTAETRQFDATQAGMYRLRLALRDVLDGPMDAAETYRWLVRERDRDAAAKVAPRVRVWPLRTRGGSLSSVECAHIASELTALTESAERWAAYEEAVNSLSDSASAPPDLRTFLVSFAEFCSFAATLAGCREGAGDAPDGPSYQVPAQVFTIRPDLESRVRARCAAAESWAKDKHALTLTFSLSGLATLERLAAETRGLDEASHEDEGLSLSVYALECLRRRHGGDWGVIGASLLGVKLASGVVVPLTLVNRFFEAQSAAPWRYTLEEYGMLPLQLPI